MLPSLRLFRSRWAALLWAGGILWAAADVAHSASAVDDDAASRSELNVADLDALSNTLNR